MEVGAVAGWSSAEGGRLGTARVRVELQGAAAEMRPAGGRPAASGRKAPGRAAASGSVWRGRERRVTRGRESLLELGEGACRRSGGSGKEALRERTAPVALSWALGWSPVAMVTATLLPGCPGGEGERRGTARFRNARSGAEEFAREICALSLEGEPRLQRHSHENLI